MIMNATQNRNNSRNIETVKCKGTPQSFSALCEVTTSENLKIILPMVIRSNNASQARICKNSYIELPDTIGGFPMIVNPTDALLKVSETGYLANSTPNSQYGTYKVLKDFGIDMDD
jgi:hypothetical protein|nr:MAG TPA: hypothetical protein [Caudoviricetes sp.]